MRPLCRIQIIRHKGLAPASGSAAGLLYMRRSREGLKQPQGERGCAQGSNVDTTRGGAIRPHHKAALIGTGLIVLVAAGYWSWPQATETARAARPARPAVPVSIALARRQDLPIYLTGIGTVQASFTVKITAQVDGKLQEVLFTEGQRVQKGDVLAKLDPRLFQAALDQAKAKRAQDVAQLVAADKDLMRQKTLAQRDYASQQNVDLAQSKADQLKASIAADEAAIETAQTQLDYTTVTAPSDGRIGIRLVDPGNLVRTADASAIATLMLTQPAAILFTLPSRVLGDVREAMARGPIEVLTFDQNNRRQLATGKLLLVDNAVDQTTSTIRLKAMFPNEDERLWPGDFVNARLLLETQPNVLVVPSAAIQRGPRGLFAWIVTANNTAEPRTIEVGASSGELAVITTGLNEGDRVVTDGQYKLSRNAPVSITPSQSAEVGGPK
jgi:multidrug efflux system membrane fusion protein